MGHKELTNSAEVTVEQLHSQAVLLFTQFSKGGRTECLKEAIVLGRKALELCPPGHPKRWDSLNGLGAHFHHYYRLGGTTDINEPVILARKALEICPREHPKHSSSLYNLSLYLSDRYKQFGAMADLNEAISLNQEALQLRPPGHQNRFGCINNLSNRLSDRYNQLGAMADLNEAISLSQEALQICPPEYPNRFGYLNNLSNRLSNRYNQLGAMADLNEAISLSREALQICPPEYQNRSGFLNNLSNRLSDRYSRFRTMVDLNEAISLSQEALQLCPPGHPLRPLSLSNLANRLSDRYSRLREMADLNEAISLNQEALRLRPPGHPNRSATLWSLTSLLQTRSRHSGHSTNMEELFSLYTELTLVPQIVSSSDLSAIKQWVCAAEHFHHPSMVLAYETYLRSLIHHLAALPPLPQHLPILKNLASSLAADAFSACLRNHDPEKAVELIEQGRGLFWNQITRLRSPLDDVGADGMAGKALADEFTEITSKIRDAINLPGADQHDRICHLNFDLESVATRIRELPGFSRFLLPSLFSDLQSAACDGPVVIVNASKYTCDALLVFVDRDPVHVPLQITKPRVRELSLELQSLTLDAKKMDRTRDLALILRQLWDDVVLPVVDFLKSEVQLSAQSRVWWCPTAEFTFFPFHAAGPYRKGQQNLSDLYISSYTPTLTALIRSRQRISSISATWEKHVVAMGQRTATGESELAAVGTELAIVGQRLQNLATFTSIEGPESCITRVSEELSKNEWVHLACHGLPNRKRPFESAFALYDGHFTIEHIIRCELEHAEFAYLSACHTTVGDEESPDEVIHLASAMHFAGFRSVIGTMWGVDDGQTSKITSTFYTHMVDESGRLDYARAAFALNETMKRVDIPFDQRIVYIHIGA